MKTKRITGDAVVRALKVIGRVVNVRELARVVGTDDTRTVASASRKPSADGRIRISYPRRGGGARYKFVRLSPSGRQTKG